jgi:hypothetical protein
MATGTVGVKGPGASEGCPALAGRLKRLKQPCVWQFQPMGAVIG